MNKYIRGYLLDPIILLILFLGATIYGPYMFYFSDYHGTLRRTFMVTFPFSWTLSLFFFIPRLSRFFRAIMDLVTKQTIISEIVIGRIDHDQTFDSNAKIKYDQVYPKGSRFKYLILDKRIRSDQLQRERKYKFRHTRYLRLIIDIIEN